jgi:membrane protein YqaA with SNARE-associated domain
MARTSAWCCRHGWLVGFVWGFAESTVFFIVPDVGVAFVAAMAPRNWWKAALASIVGTLVGAVVLFVASQFWLGAHAAHLLLWIPGIHPASLALAITRISDRGAGALLLAAFQGIPYKVYATQLTLAGVSLPVLLLWTIPSRALRLAPVAAAAGVGGRILQGSLRRHFGLWVGAYVLFWVGFYAWYWTR